jgi:hypothetical protein
MPPCWFAVFRVLYRLLTILARLTVRSGRSKDLGLIVLHHQNAVLRRQITRPTLTDDDRTMLGAIAAALPHRRRDGWIVTPETLLRWNRQRIAKHWTQPPTPRIGRPPISAELRRLIVARLTYARLDAELIVAVVDAIGEAACVDPDDWPVARQRQLLEHCLAQTLLS